MRARRFDTAMSSGLVAEGATHAHVVIEAQCSPNADRPAVQHITIVGRDDDGRAVSTLEALRWAEICFDITRAENLVAAFDEHSGFAYGLAEEVRRRRRSLEVRHGSDGSFASGFIGILDIRTVPDAAGRRFGLQLIDFLRRMHAGMAWYAALQAAPYEMAVGTPAYRAMRRRLVAYYASDGALGFEEDAARTSPGLMTALWDQD